MPTLNPALEEFWRAEATGRVLYGGRISSKSTDAAGNALIVAKTGRARFLCVRQFQNKIAESVYTLLQLQMERFGWSNEFDITDRHIAHKSTKSEFIFYGLARNLQEIRSLEDIDVTWIEEAHFLTKEQWDVLEPTVNRKEGSEIWLIFNPMYATDFAYQRFVVNPPKGFVVRKINYEENPFLSNTARAIIARCKAESEDDYQHIYLGNPKQDAEGAVIKRSWIDAAVDAHVKLGFEPAGRKVIGFDVADDGEDACANVYAHGSVAFWCEEWRAREDELLKSCSRSFLNALQRKAEIRYDSIGVGASAGAKFDELNQTRQSHERIRYEKFNAGAAVERPEEFYVSDLQGHIKNKDFFANLKAQAWWGIADRFRNTYNAINRGEKFPDDSLISIAGDMPYLEKLKTELSTPKRDFDRNGRVKVESKEDLGKSTRPGGAVPSPNCFIAGTMVETPLGPVPIENLKPGDEVVTPMGTSRIIVTHVNHAQVISSFGLTGTPNHKVFTWNRGWCELQMLSSCDMLEPYRRWGSTWRIMNALFTKARCSQFSTRVDTIAQEGTAGRTLELRDFYIGGYGLTITAKFLAAVQSITSTAIGAITALRTLSASLLASMPVCICVSDSNRKSIALRMLNLLSWRKRVQSPGMLATRAANGTASMRETSHPGCRTQSMFALRVGNPSYPETQEAQKPVPANVEPVSKTQGPKSPVNRGAEIAELYSGIPNQKKGICARSAPANAPQFIETVYNLTLDDHNAYYANGLLVKNCADAFVMAFAPLTTSRLRISPEVLAAAMR